MRILIATGIEELDQGVARELSRQDVEMIGECYYREGLLSLAKNRGAGVVIVSPHLPGQTDMVDMVKELRMAGLRVVLLPGRRDDKKAVDLVRRAVALGVYDIVWDPVSLAAVARRALNPATLAEAGAEPEEEAPGVIVKKTEKDDLIKQVKRKLSEVIKAADKADRAKAGEEALYSVKTNRKKTWPLILRSKNENVIAVISGEGGGKTTVAVNLAVTLSMQGYTIAFIDGDLESLVAHRLVGGVPAGRSLIYALENPSEAAELLEPVPFVPQMYALTADPEHEVDAGLYSRLPEVIKKVSSVVDMVVVDTSPEIKRIKHLAKVVGRTVIVVSPGDNLEERDALKVPRPVLVLNRWPAGMDVSLGEELYGLRASCVIPELEEIIKAEQGGVPAVLGCSQLYRALNTVAGKL